MTKKHAMLKIVTCSATNNSPAAYSVMKRRSRLMGLDTNKSIEPLVKRSGKIPAVEIMAKIVASHDSQMPMPICTNIVL